ncbi:MAG TPA: c-type cytochrome, partial [Acidobacteriota bacterium]
QVQKSATSLADKEIREVMAVLRLVGADDLTPLYTIPPKVRFGAHFFYSKACLNCHRIDGQGGKMAEVKSPDLTFRLLRPKQWHLEHIRDATSVVPNSKMPPFLHYEPYEYDALAEYILYLHTP